MHVAASQHGHIAHYVMRNNSVICVTISVLHIYIYIYTHTHTYIHTCIYIYIHTHTHIYIYNTCIHIYTHASRIAYTKGVDIQRQCVCETCMCTLHTR